VSGRPAVPSGDARNQASWMGSCPLPVGRTWVTPSRSARRSATIPSATNEPTTAAQRGRSPPLSPGGRDTGLRRCGGGTGVIVAVIGRPARPYGSVTAPRSAPVTNRAYLASTPWCSGARTPSTHRRAGPAPPHRPRGRCGAVHVDDDAVPISHEGDGAAVDRLGGDVADAETRGPPAEPAVGDERAVPPRPTPFMAPVTASISRMPGPPFGPS